MQKEVGHQSCLLRAYLVREGVRAIILSWKRKSLFEERRTRIMLTFCQLLPRTQIEELTSNLPQLQSLSSSTSSVDSMVSSETASPPSKRKVATKIQGNAKRTLLKWVQCTTSK